MQNMHHGDTTESAETKKNIQTSLTKNSSSCSSEGSCLILSFSSVSWNDGHSLSFSGVPSAVFIIKRATRNNTFTPAQNKK